MIPAPPAALPVPPPAPRKPGRLRPGALVALVAPAGPVAGGAVEAAEARVRSMGWEPRPGSSARLREGFLAGPDERRLADLQGALDDPTIDAIWALRGGHGTTRIVDRLDLRRQALDPIPFIGFSDNTAMHLRHAALGVVSFHGPHAAGEVDRDALEWLQRMLSEPVPVGRLPEAEGTGGSREEAVGAAAGWAHVAEGRLHGGNLALVSASCGTRDARSAGERILVLEDVGEPAYRVDRMLVQIDRAGVSRGLAGIAFGRFTGGPDSGDVDDVLRRWADARDVPAAFDLPFGHVPGNWALPLGCMARVDGREGSLAILEAAVV